MKRFLIFMLSFLMIVCSGCAPLNGDETLPKPTETQPETVPDVTQATVPADTTGPAPQETEPLPDPLEALLQGMTVEELVGQLFLVACPNSEVLESIRKYHFGGFILFGDDLKGKTPDTLRSFLTSCQEASRTPMLIAVDEEGGSVCRISSQKAFRSKRFSSPGSLLEQGGLELLLETEKEKCLLLKSLGINVNLAPVCDIATDPKAFMYSRSFRQSPEDTADSIRAVVNLMNQYQVGSALKHFPGYGNNTDTHVAVAVDKRSLAELEQRDLVPFQAGAAADAGAIMVSHTIVNALDDKMPASLSAPVHTYLRQKMGFEGVIITDDLKMAAVTDLYGDGEAAILAVLAGNDLLCTWEYETQYAAVLNAVKTGRIPSQRLEESVLRILRWKQALGLLKE